MVIEFLKNPDEEKNLRSIQKKKKKHYIQKISDKNKIELLVRQKYSPEDCGTLSLPST